jgi:hypothetical protein
MTQNEIIEMADKADAEADNVLNMKGEYHPNWHQVRDEIFAKLVAAKEREACAELRKTLSAVPNRHVPQLQPAVESALDFYAERIRARGEA